ncbi:MAG: hypothetical protein AAB628_01385 [Patescibacteria group bacterium]
MSKNHKKPCPEQYRKSGEVVAKAVEQTDPKIIWEGWNGVLLVEGMRFSVADVEVYSSGKTVRAVHVLDAPAGTELSGLGGSETYVTVAQLHMNQFDSRLHVVATKEIQNRIWICLNRILVEAEIKTVNRPVPQENRPNEKKYSRKISPSFEDFVAGVPSEYCFDKGSPYAVFKIRLESYTAKSGEVMQVPVILVVSIEAEHSLCGLVTVGTKFFHNKLFSAGEPNFRNTHASSQLKMWKFLRLLYAAHRNKETRHLRKVDASFPPKLTLVPTT